MTKRWSAKQLALCLLRENGSAYPLGTLTRLASMIRNNARLATWRWMFVILTTLCIFSFDSSNARAESSHLECRRSIRDAVNAISETTKNIHKSIPKNASGPQVEVGSCASRLKKLAGNFLCCKADATTARYWEEISCLDLKKYYLEQTCFCLSKGLSFSTDETIQDQTLELYATIRSLEKKGVNLGVQNSIIREIVKQASSIKNCYSIGSLEILRDIERKLSAAVEGAQ